MKKEEDNTELFAMRDGWYKESSEQTLKTLPGFLSKLAEHPHDYNTIVYALAAAALGAARALDRTPNGGITGFQAGAVFWEFYGEWMHQKNKPARIVKYEDMLVPQNESKFKTITQKTWEWLYEAASKNLREKENAHPNQRVGRS